MKKMKSGKAARPSGVVAEMLFAGGEDSVSGLVYLIESFVRVKYQMTGRRAGWSQYTSVRVTHWSAVPTEG